MNDGHAKLFQLSKSPCCPGSVRVRVGRERICLSVQEVRGAETALESLRRQVRRKCGAPTVAGALGPCDRWANGSDGRCGAHRG